MVERRKPGPIYGNFRALSSNGHLYADEDNRYTLRFLHSNRYPQGMTEIVKLRDKYELPMPKFSTSDREFIDTSESVALPLTARGEFWLVAEYVDGYSFDFLHKIPREQLLWLPDSANETCAKLAQYFYDTITSGNGDYLSDLKPEQFMNAHKRKSLNMQMMLVDLDPFMSNIYDSRLVDFFRNGPEMVAYLVDLVEKKTSVRLRDARNELLKFSKLDSLKQFTTDGGWDEVINKG